MKQVYKFLINIMPQKFSILLKSQFKHKPCNENRQHNKIKCKILFSDNLDVMEVGRRTSSLITIKF